MPPWEQQLVTVTAKWQGFSVVNDRGVVVLVFKSGHEMPQNADRLTRGQRLHFWRIVQKWVALERDNRDKSTKSGRSNRNGDCVNNSRSR